MTANILRKLRALSFIAAASFAIFLSSCQMCQVTKDCANCDDECHPAAKICHNPTMHALASDLDHLEEHIDKYGSVVAMQPAVWGQARLTKYRQEFEDEMFKEFKTFVPTLQGSLSRSDQAFLANATAISAALGGQQAGTTPPSPVLVQNVTPAKDQTLQTATKQDAPTITPDIADVLKGIDAIKRSDPISHTARGFLDTTTKISLEPTIFLDQKARYLNHLNQIRRNNEGDDTADAPGYSLNLVRVPVSVLPGKCTTKGYGAEITMTLKPYISDELLPATFRQLVVNDIVDMLALPLAKYADLIGEEASKLNSGAGAAKSAIEKARMEARTEVSKKVIQPKKINGKPPEIKNGEPKKEVIKTGEAKKEDANQDDADKKKKERDMINDKVSAFMKGSSRQRVASHPLPPSQIVPVLGLESLTRISVQVDTVISSHENSQNHVYLLDARATLRDEVEAAYELLARNTEKWLRPYCTSALAQAIRSRNDQFTTQQRENFLGHFPTQLVTADLAWAIIVESALLNEKLKDDMRQAAANTGKFIPNADVLEFFLPAPMLTAEAKHAFNEYVRVRWPIHVFAVDPVSQDQNIADTYSKRQEMQLALTLAFVSGNMNANSMTRYARRIEKDMETIAINRTQIGFSHGEDTFGWRFYPRFQSPPIESNFTTIFRDQIIGGPSKNAEIRQTRLEPGMRECVAIVLMPAFVPYVTCETSSNWFKLTNPKCKEFTLTDAIRLGKVVKSVQTCSPNIKNANCYRDGDLARLLTKAKQLEARLPLQDMLVQVPYENTLGGFEMFNTGITDLAPELVGWYGAPGIQKSSPTQLFLVGDHFSVHHTRVTAGGRDVGFELISRQIMRVTIPENAGSGKNKYVDVHVATPYGVTAHLEIPLIESAPAKNEFTWVLPTPTPTATLTPDKKIGVASFKFDKNPPDATIVDNTVPVKEVPLGAAELTLKITIYAKDGTALVSSVPTGPISLAFKDGKATVKFADLGSKIEKTLLDALAKQTIKKDDFVRLDITGFVGGKDGSGITIAVLPPFAIVITTSDPATAALPILERPGLAGPTFGTPAATRDDPRSEPLSVATLPNR